MKGPARTQSVELYRANKDSRYQGNHVRVGVSATNNIAQSKSYAYHSSSKAINECHVTVVTHLEAVSAPVKVESQSKELQKIVESMEYLIVKKLSILIC
jgi:hypothetical protein